MIGVGRDFKDHIAPTFCHVQRHMICLSLHRCYVDRILPRAMARGTKLQFTFVHLWYFCLGVWCRCVSEKWSPLKAGYHAAHTKGSTSHLQHMNCCPTPTTHCHHFKHSIFSWWAFLLYIYPIVFPSCPSCLYSSLKGTKTVATQQTQLILFHCTAEAVFPMNMYPWLPAKTVVSFVSLPTHRPQGHLSVSGASLHGMFRGNDCLALSNSWFSQHLFMSLRVPQACFICFMKAIHKFPRILQRG